MKKNILLINIMSFKPLTIGSRAYKYIRMGAIKSVNDALIELITNSHDAYNKSTGLDTPYCICIQPIYENKKLLKEINVRDQAIGLNGDEMENNFLTVGNYTSSSDSRGFFSRGAKDVSNIGDISFVAIKDGKYSKIEINTEGMGRTVVKDNDVTEELRISTGIKVNGLKVNIKLLPPFKKITPSQIKKQLNDHYALRDIISDPNYHITVSYLGKCKEKGQECDVKYEEPSDKQLLVEADYILKKYNNASATLKIYSTNLYNPDKAILVKSDTTVYCKTIFDRKISGHPYIKRVYGEIKCNKIHELLYDIETNGISDKNPWCCIDHSRGGGLDKTHPFVKELYEYPKIKLLQVLQTMEDTEESAFIIHSKDISDLIDQLNLLGNQFELGGKRQYSWRQDRTGTHIKAVDGARDEYVDVEKNFEYISAAEIRRREKQSSYSRYGSHSGSNLGPHRTPKILIYERDQTGELRKLSILENGNLVEHIDGAHEDIVFQEPAVKHFKITFSTKDKVTQRYDIYETSSEVILRIYTNEKLLSSYLKDVTDANSLTNDKSKIMLSEIVTEAFAGLMTKNEMELESDNYDLMTTSEMLTNYQKLYNENVQKIELAINNTIKGLN